VNVAFRSAKLRFDTRLVGPLIAVITVGCDYTLPSRSQQFPTAVVEGIVLLAGKPLPNGGTGWVTFFPEGGSLGDPTVCRLKPDGTYFCDRVSVGPNNIRIDVAPSVLAQSPPIVKNSNAILRGPRSPLRIVTKSEEKARFDFDFAQ
jgi:hypothetical protein